MSYTRQDEIDRLMDQLGRSLGHLKTYADLTRASRSNPAAVAAYARTALTSAQVVVTMLEGLSKADGKTP